LNFDLRNDNIADGPWGAAASEAIKIENSNLKILI
jgi:hypothetical protein